MADQTSEADAAAIEALALELRETEIARYVARNPGCTASADTPRPTAADVVRSRWLREYAIRERAAALREAADALDDAQTPDNEMAAAIRRDPAAWLSTCADAVEAGHPLCDTCHGLGRVPHMIEGDPYGHERDDDGLTRCLDCHGVGHV